MKKASSPALGVASVDWRHCFTVRHQIEDAEFGDSMPTPDLSQGFQEALYLVRRCSCQSGGRRDTGDHTGKDSGNLAHTSPEDTLWRGNGGRQVSP